MGKGAENEVVVGNKAGEAQYGKCPFKQNLCCDGLCPDIWPDCTNAIKGFASAETAACITVFLRNGTLYHEAKARQTCLVQKALPYKIAAL